MNKIIVAAGFALMSATSAVAASPFSSIYSDPNVLVNVAAMDELACYGCVSPSTGRVRDGYVSPHIHSNGSYINGYWRS
jgi:hypothetical protein